MMWVLFEGGFSTRRTQSVKAASKQRFFPTRTGLSASAVVMPSLCSRLSARNHVRGGDLTPPTYLRVGGCGYYSRADTI